MKILFMSNLYPPFSEGGYELRCQETAKEFERRGHKVSVLTTRWGIEKPCIEGNVHRLLYYDPVGNSGRRQTLPDPLRFCRRYNQLRWALQCRHNYRIGHEMCISDMPDVVFVWNMGRAGVAPILAAQGLGIPTAYSLGDYWLTSLKAQLCQEGSSLKRWYRSAMIGLWDFQRLDISHMIANSEALKKFYVANGFGAASIAVIPRGIPVRLIMDEAELPNSSRMAGSAVQLIFSGRIVPEKGPDIAIRATAHLVEELGPNSVRLDIAGAGDKEYERSLKRLAAELGLQTQVVFLGKLERQQLLDMYTTYDALLFPSTWEEPLGGTVLEAMARGLPVISTDTGGSPEMIRNGENGLLVRANDPQGLAEAVLELMRNPSLARKIRQQALRTMRERFTLDHIVDQLLAYLQSVAQSTERRESPSEV